MAAVNEALVFPHFEKVTLVDTHKFERQQGGSVDNNIP